MGSRVSATVRLVSRRASQTDVSVLAPVSIPAVANGPVQLTILFAVSNQHNCVVNVDIFGSIASTEDSRTVASPAGIHRDRDGTHSRDGVHQSCVVVLRQLHEAGDVSHRSSAGDATLAIGATVGSVALLELLVHAHRASQIIEGNLGSGTSAATTATTVIGVGGAEGSLFNTRMRNSKST
jgi:hypothetical protein